MTLIITAKQNTKLKLATGQSKDLKPEQIYTVPVGHQLTVLAHRPESDNHTYVTLSTTLQGRNSWYIYQPHWDGFKTGKLMATFKPTGKYDEYGGCIFNMTLEMDGDRVVIPCGSGQPGHDPVPVSRDYPGSMNPIPQGLYRLEKTVYESLSTCDPAIGPVWIALTPLEETNGRGGFLIHPDFNWQRSPGTAGCPFPQRNRDIRTIAEWNDRSSEAVLSVEYGF